MRGEQYLTKNAQYGLVYDKGDSWVNKTLVMKALPNGLEITRYGFSVSRRVGNAVVRNRVKRLLREVLRQTQLQPGRDLVFIARIPAAKATYEIITRSVRDLLYRAGLLMGEHEGASPRVN